MFFFLNIKGHFSTFCILSLLCAKWKVIKKQLDGFCNLSKAQICCCCSEGCTLNVIFDGFVRWVLFPVELLVLKKVHSSSIIDINLICLCLVSCVCDKIDDLTISTSPSVLAPKLLKTSLLTYSFFMMFLPSIFCKKTRKSLEGKSILRIQRKEIE